MPSCARRKAGAWLTSSPKKVTRPLSIGTKPVTALKRVVLPAPLGPMRPRISDGLSDRETLSTATTPPKRTVMFSALSASGIAPPNQPAIEFADDAAGKEENDQEDENSVNQQIGLGEACAEDFAGADQQNRADEAAPDRAPSPDAGGQGDLYREQQEEDNVGLQEGQHPAVDAASDGGEPAGQHEGLQLDPGRVDARRHGRVLVLAYRSQLVAETTARDPDHRSDHAQGKGKRQVELGQPVEKVDAEGGG